MSRGEKADITVIGVVPYRKLWGGGEAGEMEGKKFFSADGGVKKTRDEHGQALQ